MSRTLVAYFSASGVTAKAADTLAKAADADLFEIVPQEIYTKADLNWRDKKSRSSVEMNDRASRPAIASKMENPEQYDTVFIGFPVWWYREPSIIDTFLESYDFTGKTIVPFCTSGGSGIGEAPANMQALAKGAKVLGGKRLTARETEEDMKAWIQNTIEKE